MSHFRLVTKIKDSGSIRYRHYIDNKRVDINTFYSASMPEYARDFKETTKRKNDAIFNYKEWKQ